jgi:hypothetical protein
MMKAWILDPLPFPRPDSLIDLRSLDTVTGSVSSLNPADFLDLTPLGRSRAARRTTAIKSASPAEIGRSVCTGRE